MDVLNLESLWIESGLSVQCGQALCDNTREIGIITKRSVVINLASTLAMFIRTYVSVMLKNE